MNFVKKSVLILLTLMVGLGVLLSAYLDGHIFQQKRAFSITAHGTNFKSGAYYPVPQDTFFILVIGNDYRPGVEGHRADGIHVVGVNPSENRATIINFPRDTNVDIPGRGRNKINAANAYGGSDLTRQTVENLMQLSISYTLEVDFEGFVNVVNQLGGLDVPVERRMNDRFSGSNFEPGIVHMDGGQALAFARDRYSFSDGDISRTTNQGVLLVSALKELKKSKGSITDKFESASIIARNVALTNLNLRSIYLLMELATKIDSDNIPNMTVPWSGSNTLAPRAHDLFADFRDNAILDTYR